MKDELESCWDEIVAGPRIVTASSKACDTEGLLRLTAAETSEAFVRQYQEQHPGVDAIPLGSVAELLHEGLQQFTSRFYEHLRSQDMAGLLEFMLDGQVGLTPEEITGFLQALPMSLLVRIAETPVGVANGTHALVSFEVHRRSNLVQYQLVKDLDGRVQVTVTRPDNAHPPLTFQLAETIRLNP